MPTATSTADDNRVTAAAVGAWGWSLPAVDQRQGRAKRPARDAAAPADRAKGVPAAAWPLGLSAGLVLLLGVAVAARGPITHILGTADTAAGAATPAVGTDATPARPVGLPVPVAAPAVSVRLHRPHDPFAPRIDDKGGLLPFVTPVSSRSSHTTGSHTTGSHTPGTSAGHTAGQRCSAGASYQVRPGDSLWRIAGGDLARVQRIYLANRAKIGAQPSLLLAGITLCLPAR